MADQDISPNTVPLIQSGTGIFSTILQNWYNRRAQQREFDNNLKMWRLSNAYNDPSAQMARLRAAGLNPNLVYGQSAGGSTGNTSTTMPRYQADVADFSGISDGISQGISSYIDYRQKLAGIRNMDADTQNKDTQNIILAADARTKGEINQAQLDSLLETAESRRLQNDISRTYGSSQAAASLEATQSSTRRSNQLVRESEATVRRTNAEISRIGQDTLRIKAQIDNINASTDLVTSQGAKLIIDTALLEKYGESIEAARLEKLKQEIQNMTSEDRQTLARALELELKNTGDINYERLTGDDSWTGFWGFIGRYVFRK